MAGQDDGPSDPTAGKARRRPPDTTRGPTRDLSARGRRYVERVGRIDRREQARRRHEEVLAEEARARKRDRTLTLAGWGVVAVFLGGVGWAASRMTGLGAGLAVTLVAAGAWWLLGRVAARRGASAWDWRARRYRLVGDPSRKVQRLDDPRTADQERGPMGPRHLDRN